MRSESIKHALAHASHELRGAVAAAELCLSLLERRTEGDRLHAWAADLRAQLERASWVVEDLEHLSSSGEARVVSEPVEVSDLVRRRTRAWARLARSSGKALDCDWQAGTVNVCGDARRLCQALDNLISNAIKHGGDSVVVSGALSDGRLRIAVTDGGAGTTSVAPRLARASDRHGHGLTIARLGVEACRGNLQPAGDGVVVEIPVVAPTKPTLSAA